MTRNSPIYSVCSIRATSSLVLTLIALTVLVSVGVISAQETAVRSSAHTSGLPLGEVGQTRLMRAGARPELASYYQPVRFSAPQGVQIAMAADGDFVPSRPVPFTAGLLVGRVYRLRVTHIPLAIGIELFPTVEIIDRTYPPQGRELEFPVEVELTHDDIMLAAEGKYVTKVIYLEHPSTAFPDQATAGTTPVFDVAPTSDPLMIADSLGRPMALVRLGGRLPSPHPAELTAFLLGCPSWLEITTDSRGMLLFFPRSTAMKAIQSPPYY